MDLSQVKDYTEGLLKKWFTNKKTLDKLSTSNNKLMFDGSEVGGGSSFSNEEVLKKLNETSEGNVTYNSNELSKKFENEETLNKLGIDTDGDLTVDGNKINEWESCYCKKINLLPSVKTFKNTATTGTGQMEVNSLITLSDKVEKYAYVLMTYTWYNLTTTTDAYTCVRVLRTDIGQNMQWTDSIWGGDEYNTSNQHYVTSRCNFVLRLYNNILHIDFMQLSDNTGVKIEKIEGILFDNAPDATETAHSHDNKEILDLVTEPSTGVLAFRGNPINSTCYIKDLWSGNLTMGTKGTSISTEYALSLKEKAQNYDALIFTFKLDIYTNTSMVVGTNTCTASNPYFTDVTWGGVHAGIIYYIKTGGGITIINRMQDGWTTGYLTKVQGLKFAK